MFFLRLATLPLAATLVLGLASPATACACCPDEDAHSIDFQKWSSHERDTLKQLRFGPSARLNVGQRESSAFTDMVHPAEAYPVKGALVGDAWRLTLRTKGGDGTLDLLLPAGFSRHAVDIHDGRKFSGGGPLLYKEWRFEGALKQSGLFKAGKSIPTRYALVLQGRGGQCDEPAEFTHWHLSLTGAANPYTFTGAFQR